MIDEHGRARRGVTRLVLGACLLAGVATRSLAGSDVEARLGALRERIETLTRELRETRDARDRLSASLRESELKAAALAAELAALERRRQGRERRMAELTAERRRLAAAVADHRLELERHVRAAYATGRQDRLKLLLNQENPATLSRVLAYYAYFNRARARRIAVLAADLERLGAVGQQLSGEARELARLVAERSDALEALDAERALRRDLLARLADELDSKSARLARLERDERELAALVGRLAQELADIPPGAGAEVPFSRRRGELRWPTAGTLRYRFGTPRGSGDLNWNGVLIEASPGSPVHAVSHGRVAFADWLRGFGLLMIIEHGDGYMSLYGHNQTLLREVGDWVAQDEVVASVGDSGGRSGTGLYFEIRHDGAPVDPLAWCRPDPGGAAAAAVARPR